MADDKTKRLRTHVVKELFDTEKDYTDHLEFTVTVSLRSLSGELREPLTAKNGACY